VVRLEDQDDAVLARAIPGLVLETVVEGEELAFAPGVHLVADADRGEGAGAVVLKRLADAERDGDRVYAVLKAVGLAGLKGRAQAIRRAYRLIEDEAVLQVRADRHTFRPYGLYGGGPGKPSRNRLLSNGEERELTAKVTMTPMRRGDVFIHDQPGPGGWGDPLERDPGLVARDVRYGLVSAAQAQSGYGVVLTADQQPDLAATQRRREAARKERGQPSRFDFGYTPPAREAAE